MRKAFCCAPLYRSDLKNEECESGSFWTALKFNHPKTGSQPSRVAKPQAKKKDRRSHQDEIAMCRMESGEGRGDKMGSRRGYEAEKEKKIATHEIAT